MRRGAEPQENFFQGRFPWLQGCEVSLLQSAPPPEQAVLRQREGDARRRAMLLPSCICWPPAAREVSAFEAESLP